MDIEQDHPQYPEIYYLADRSIEPNDTDFSVQEPITRGEYATMLVKALGYKDVAPVNTKFRDMKNNNADSGYIQIAVEKGIVNGYDDGTFKPNQTLNRGHAATFLSRMYTFKESTRTFKTFQHLTQHIKPYNRFFVRMSQRGTKIIRFDQMLR